MIQDLKIIQWNIRGVFNNLENLRYLLEEQKPDIIMLEETWFKSRDKFNHKDYVIYRKDRIDGYGGIAALIHREIIHREIGPMQGPIPEKCQIQMFELVTHKIIISNVYFHPSNRITQSLLEKFLDFSSYPIIMLGDFNSHHSLWGSEWKDQNGENVASFIRENNLVVLNDGSPTRFQRPNLRKSIVDLAICSQSLAHKFVWMVHQDPGSSDHFPIICKKNRQIQREKGGTSNKKEI